MDISFIKGNNKYSDLICVRSDGTQTATQMPEQGIAPHDMIHYVVEKYCQLTGALYGQVKAGADISFTLEHNQLSREIADREQVWQAESMVEALQSLLWSGQPCYADFNYLVEQACSSRNVPVKAVSEDVFNEMAGALLALNTNWQQATPGTRITLTF